MMNAYWIATKMIELHEPIVISDEIHGSQLIDWAAARLVFAESRSQARYIFWRDCWQEETYGQLFEESLNDIRTIRLIAKNIDHAPGVEDFPADEERWYCDDDGVYDLAEIDDPIWREIARRFWNTKELQS